MNLDDVRNGLKRLLPIIEVAARLTPNKLDDAAVEFLKRLLLDDKAMAQAVADAK